MRPLSSSSGVVDQAAAGNPIYTVVTFAPVQSFIASSRKLRDLYGSSLLLSHLAKAIADDAKSSGKGHMVISPASVNSSRGVPNVLVIEGNYLKGHAQAALLASWDRVLKACRTWLERNLQGSLIAPSDWDRGWGTSWKASTLHSWELFHGQGSTIQTARKALAVSKLGRAWSVPNWTGESSTLSSVGAVVRPRMGEVIDPRNLDAFAARDEARAFLALLREKLGEAFAGENEELSLLELVKRLVTYPDVTRRAFATPDDPEPDLNELTPQRFQKLSGSEQDKPESIVWFMADGDSISNHLESLAGELGEAEALRNFSAGMRDWAVGLYRKVPKVMDNKAMVIYAGGDDIFGALHESMPGKMDLKAADLWKWLKNFPELWKGCKQPDLTISMGLVWSETSVPQREALQHARDAEASAKARGRNRFALRLLYASGNHLEWTCPWDWLEQIRNGYCDREGNRGERANWRHLADDLAWLRSRQAIALDSDPVKDMGPKSESSHDKEKTEEQTTHRAHKSSGTARALWNAYFPGCVLPPETRNPSKKTNPPSSPIDPTREADSPLFLATQEQPEQGRSFDEWLLDLGRVMAGLKKWDKLPKRQEATA
jgi:CRISPR-associated protein Cmr2